VAGCCKYGNEPSGSNVGNLTKEVVPVFLLTKHHAMEAY
jgi:hypothetical protein